MQTWISRSMKCTWSKCWSLPRWACYTQLKISRN